MVSPGCGWLPGVNYIGCRLPNCRQIFDLLGLVWTSSCGLDKLELTVSSCLRWLRREKTYSYFNQTGEPPKSFLIREALNYVRHGGSPRPDSLRGSAPSFWVQGFPKVPQAEIEMPGSAHQRIDIHKTTCKVLWPLALFPRAFSFHSTTYS
jgi:hypothetical protein